MQVHDYELNEYIILSRCVFTQETMSCPQAHSLQIPEADYILTGGRGILSPGSLENSKNQRFALTVTL